MIRRTIPPSVIMAIIFAALIIFIVLATSTNKKEFPETPTRDLSTETSKVITFTPTVTYVTSPTTTAIATSTQVLTATATFFLPLEITDAKGVQMMFVPAGEFIMGSIIGDPDEKPIHRVYLDSFYIDKYEVTNKLYKACIDVAACDPPKRTDSTTRASYYGNPEFDNYPVVNVDWEMAQTYCKWRGVQLPTEAQWEKAARGTDGRTYPWGESTDKIYANSDQILPDTTIAGSYESGKSIYGVYDMAGNVFEWVEDWYSATYYMNSPFSNPPGPEADLYRVIRGGSWKSFAYSFRSTFRGAYDLPEGFGPNLGFRCANDANS